VDGGDGEGEGSRPVEVAEGVAEGVAVGVAL
jgi:hypothetical protein